MNYERLLEGKKALITAGADGIGYAIAQRFEKAGAKVFVCDINEEAVNQLVPFEQASAYIQIHKLRHEIHDNVKTYLQILCLFTRFNAIVVKFFEIFQRILIHGIHRGQVSNDKVEKGTTRRRCSVSLTSLGDADVRLLGFCHPLVDHSRSHF